MKSFLSRYLDSLVNAPRQTTYSPERPGRSRHGYSFGERYRASLTRTTLPPRTSQTREAGDPHPVQSTGIDIITLAPKAPPDRTRQLKLADIAAVAVVAVAVAGLAFALIVKDQLAATGPPIGISVSPPPSTATTTPTATAEFTNLHQGSTVSFTQQVAGRVANIPNGMNIWLVVQPLLAPLYWPQPGPLLLDPHGQFHAHAYFGPSAATYKGERFILTIVEAPPAVSQLFKDLLSQPQGVGLGLLRLPVGTTALAVIVVMRS